LVNVMEIKPLEELAARHGELLPAAELNLPNPLLSLNIAGNARSPFVHRLITANLAGYFAQRAIELYRYPPGTRVAGGGHEPYVTLADGCLVRQQLPDWAADPSGLAHDIAATADVQLVQAPCMLVARYGDVTWGHFVCEMLPKIVLAEAAAPQRFTYVVPSRTTRPGAGVPDRYVRAVLESLCAFGIEEHRLLRLPPREVLAFDALFDLSGMFPLPGQEFFGMHPGLLSLMANRVRGEAGEHRAPKPYLVRGAGDLRQITNRHEIQATARRHGFAPIDLTDLSFAQQVDLFRNAEVISGALGSGFAGVMFARPGLPVATLAPSDWPDNYFVNLFQKRDVRHADVRGISSGTSNNDVARGSFMVPDKDFSDALELLARVGSAASDDGMVRLGENLLPRRLGEERFSLSFGMAGTALRSQTDGWAAPEPNHTWSVGTACELRVPREEIGTGDLWLEATGFTFSPPNADPMRVLSVTVNGEWLGECWLEGESRPIWLVRAELLAAADPVRIRFQHPICQSPKSLGVSADVRELGYGFRRLSCYANLPSSIHPR
jgi:hypothetical protein